MKHLLLALIVMNLSFAGYAEDVIEIAPETLAPVVEVIENAEPGAASLPEAVSASTEIPEEVVAAEPPKAPIFAVILPERIDHDWYWILYTDTAQHIVQSAVEKALVRAGLEVVDLNTASLPSVGSDVQKLMSMSFVLDAGKQMKADYVVTGQATAIKASEGVAYGVNVFRSQVEIVAKIVRVSDGKILAIEDASMQEGGQSAQAAGQSALKKAGTQVAAKIARAARSISDGEPVAQ